MQAADAIRVRRRYAVAEVGVNAVNVLTGFEDI